MKETNWEDEVYKMVDSINLVGDQRKRFTTKLIAFVRKVRMHPRENGFCCACVSDVRNIRKQVGTINLE